MSAAVEHLPTVDRNKGLGASDAPAAVGLSPWKSPLELWLEKTGRAPPTEETLPMRVGKALEPVVLRAFTEREGVRVSLPQARYVDPDRPWRWATVDGISEDGSALVEAKTAGSLDDWGEDGSDQIPMHYMIQVQHGLACTGLAMAWVPVLFFARELRVYRVPRADDLIAALTEKETAFWQQVESGTPPCAVSAADVRLKYPVDNGTSVTADDDILERLAALREAKARRDSAEDDIERHQMLVQQFMGEASNLLAPDGSVLATWKAVTSRRLDTKALTAAHPDIAARFRVESSSRRFLQK